jgi:UDP-2,3-diacylglucosamine hydrolase
VKTIERKHIPTGKKVYFASDFHLGVPDPESSRKRERLFVEWLEEIRKDASAIYLMGDVFDFWFEYKTVIPRGYSRLFGKLAELSDLGIPVHLFRGNHDIWAFDYLNEEFGVQLHRKPQLIKFNDFTFFLAHGDGIGPGDHGYKFLQALFESRFTQWLFRWLHPDVGTRLGLYFSRRSRIANIARENEREGLEPLEEIFTYKFAKQKIENGEDINYFIFGHNHQAIDHKLSDNSKYVVLGDWISLYTYAVFDGNELKLETFKKKDY